MNSKKIVITGGGTGGHVFPALAIAEEMKRRSWEVLYVGTSHGMEATLVPQAGFPFYTVKTGAVKNQSLLKIISTLAQLLKGIGWAFFFLRREKPTAVLGVGGYVSVPICLTAFLLRIPLFLQEQNSSVGIANRFLGKLAKKIFLGFPQAQSYFSEKKCISTGNPLRAAFYNPPAKPYDSKVPFILVLGGSQGAKAINDAVLNSLDKWMAFYPGLKIFHQTGKRDFESVKLTAAGRYAGAYEYAAFVPQMLELYTKASLVIARSGALTVSELIQVGRPAIFVPYPRKGQNDQITNAYLLEKHGAARVVEQGPDFNARLEKTVVETFKPSVLQEMHQAYVGLRFGNALVTIGDQIISNS